MTNVVRPQFFGRIGIGYDTGQRIDPAAIAVVATNQGLSKILAVTELGLGLELEQQADQVERAYNQALSVRAQCSHDPVVAVERNGIGAGVCEHLRKRKLPFWECTTAGGLDRNRTAKDAITVGKMGLINDLVVAFEQENIHVTADCRPDDVRKIERQLRSFIATQGVLTIRMEASAGERDDLVMALAYAHFASNNCRSIEAPRVSAPLIDKPFFQLKAF